MYAATIQSVTRCRDTQHVSGSNYCTSLPCELSCHSGALDAGGKSVGNRGCRLAELSLLQVFETAVQYARPHPSKGQKLHPLLRPATPNQRIGLAVVARKARRPQAPPCFDQRQSTATTHAHAWMVGAE
jgi:hypothetical protein